MDEFLNVLCKVKPTGKVFPLPSSLTTLGQMFPSESPGCVSLLVNLVLSLNSLFGEGLSGENVPSPFQKRILSSLVVDCRRVLNWEEKIAPVQWEEFFRVRGVDYRGDEILSAQSIQWENVAPALPDEVGAVDLEKWWSWGLWSMFVGFLSFCWTPKTRSTPVHLG